MEICRIGIVGTGYAAKKRAEAIAQDTRAVLVGVTGNSPERVESFCQEFGVSAVDSWLKLVDNPEIDLVIVCTINRDHGAIAHTALQAEKHVVVEYPLALSYREAREIVELAQNQSKLLHIEHMELIGGLHLAIKEHLPQIGNPVYARYHTVAPQQDPPRNWKYHRDLFGFPLNAALSRVHRLTDLFGSVDSIFARNRYWMRKDTDYFTACMCNAQLQFANGVVAEITYGKGDAFSWGHRTLEIQGNEGTLLFEGEKGSLIRGKEQTPISVVSRRGLFAKDTKMVLDYLFAGDKLYLEPAASLYATKVAEAARQSAQTHQAVTID